MKTKTCLLLMLCSLICIKGYCQVPVRNAKKAEITYSVINPTNRTIGVGVGKPDSTAVDPFYVGDIEIPDAVFPNNVPYKVVGITDYAFKDCNGIKKVEIGRNVSVIGKEAFNSCMGITEVKMPYNLMSVGDGAFEGARGVKSLSMNGQSVAVVGKSAFAGCTDIESVRLQPKTMASVGERAFAGCTKLKKLLVYGHIAVIGKGAFAGCTNLTDIVICSDSVMSIANDAFQGCANLQTITIRGSQPIFGTGVFAGCRNLKEVRCYTDIPPTAADGLFHEADVSNVVLKINPVSADLFKAAPSWKGFQVVEVDESALGIEEDYMFVADGADVDPEFPGGQTGMTTYLARNVKYPVKAQENGISGTVLVEFVVDKDGSVIEPGIVESLGTDCDYEALRAVSTMPKWKPGMHNGKLVRVRVTVPIRFMMGFPNANRAANRPTNVNNTSNANAAAANTKVARDGADGDDVYQTAEEMPEFPGGQAKLLEYLAANVKYPAHAREQGVQGRVIISFVIDKEGNVVEPEILRSLEDEIDQEAIRVITSMPKWKPGKNNGKPVRVKYTVPIQFKLNEFDMPKKP